jgi:hypothetical protein
LLEKLGLLLCCAALTWPSAVRAQPRGAEPSAPVEHDAVRIIKVGHAEDWRELERVLREFLLPHRLKPTFESRATLTRLDALGESPSAGARVFVELVSAERARLVLSDERRERYLLRDVPLPNGLDEVGRETLAQVIESSLVALQGQAKALSRDELNRLLTGESAFEPSESLLPNAAIAAENVAPPVLEASPVAPAPAALKAAHEPAPSVPYRSRIQLDGGYTAHWSGPELGLLHGPALRLEWAGALSAESSWFAAITGELRWHQRYESTLVDVDVASRAAWLTAGIERTWRGQLRWLAGAGVGIDWAVIQPRYVEGGLSRVLPETSDTTVWLRGELGVERRFGSVHLALSLLVDVSSLDTHYDVRRAGRAERLVTPWRVRPGVRVAVGWGS